MAVYALLLALFLASYLVIWQPAYNPPPMDEGTEIIINSENAYLVQDGEVYRLICNGYELETITEDFLSSVPYDELKIITN